MPVNRNALLRYKTIDSCLKNRRRKWTLDALIDKVSAALYGYEGIAKGISRRTLQADIQMMRSDKLGYNAPIVIVDKKYYTYELPEYSITNIPLSEQDLGMMNEAVEMLKQFKGFSHFTALNAVVQKLEDHVYAAANSTVSVIDFEKNEQLKGLEHLDVIYNAIIQKKVLDITYQSFKARNAEVIRFHAWWLKEFKNRWFAVGVRDVKDSTIQTLALDRMLQITLCDNARYKDSNTIAADYYKDIIGVTVSANLRAQKIRLFFNSKQAPYVETKPMHHSQVVEERANGGIIISIKVQVNFELEKEILGFGDGVKVLAPEFLRKKICNTLRKSLDDYEVGQADV